MESTNIYRYDCQVWEQRCNGYIESIEKTQNKAMRNFSSKGPRKGAKNLYKE